MKSRNNCHCPCHKNRNVKHVMPCCSGDWFDIVPGDPKKTWGPLSEEDERELDELTEAEHNYGREND